jgi:hypothetical protein
MHVDLYAQLEQIHNQCQRRKFTDQETIEVMRLCIYSCLGHFPNRSPTLPIKDHVLTSIKPSNAEIPTQ